MALVSRLWKVLVGIKDALALALLLLFFAGLYGVLTARAGGQRVRDGALLINLDGAVVEEPSDRGGLAQALSGVGASGEVRERDVVRALDAAVADSRIKAVAIDMSGFAGAGLVHCEEIGAAIDRVRAAHKPVLVYGFVLEDAGTLIASHASEVWVDPLGGALLPGPGGYRMYYAGLLDRLKITAHIFRVGTYKDYVEPYFRQDQSPASKAASGELYGAIWAEIRADVQAARPHAQVAAMTGDPVGWLHAHGDDAAEAAKAAGLVDRIGTRADWGARVAVLAGTDTDSQRPGAFAHTGMAAFLADHAEPTDGKAIAVVTVAGDIVDGKAGPGTAGGTRIARLIDDAAVRSDVAGIVLRVDSPGGSLTGAEAIRAALVRAKARGLPIAVSMANLAASGGYWVAMPAGRIFAQPGTITGSIGVFAVIPSFEKALAAWGVTGDGVRTTPLSGQPDVFTGLTPEISAMLQDEINGSYARFLSIVGESRHRTPAQIDAIAQGRVWDGRRAKALGLVDAFGGLADAEGWVAAQAHLGNGAWHADFVATPQKTVLQRLAALGNGGDEDDDAAANADAAVPRDWAGVVALRQREGLARVLGDAQAVLGGGGGAQAACLECLPLMPPRAIDPGMAGRAAGLLAAAGGGQAQGLLAALWSARR